MLKSRIAVALQPQLQRCEYNKVTVRYISEEFVDMKYWIFVLLTTMSSLAVVHALPQESGQADDNEVQLKNLTASVKNVSVTLSGTEREQQQLNEIRDMIQNVINNSELGVVRVPVSNEPDATPVLKTFENLEIVIGVTAPLDAIQSYKVSLTLQEAGTSIKGKPEFFDYASRDKYVLYNELKSYLTKVLNLRPRGASVSETPVIQTRPQPRTLPTTSKSVAPPAPSRVATTAPQNVNPNEELHLKNLTPAVKSISFQLKGTEREQKILRDIQNMVQEIVSSSRLNVTQETSRDIPLSTPSKTYENLEIIISATSPVEETQPYKVAITLQEAGTRGEPDFFDFLPKETRTFKRQLRNYLMENANLQAR